MDDCRQSVSCTQVMPFYCELTYQFLSCSRTTSYFVPECVSGSVCVLCGGGRRGQGVKGGCNIRPRQKKKGKSLNPNTIIKTLALSSTLPTHTTPLPLSLPISLCLALSHLLSFFPPLNQPCFLSLPPSMCMKNQQIKSYINPAMTFPT